MRLRASIRYDVCSYDCMRAVPRTTLPIQALAVKHSTILARFSDTQVMMQGTAGPQLMTRGAASLLPSGSC